MEYGLPALVAFLVSYFAVYGIISLAEDIEDPRGNWACTDGYYTGEPPEDKIFTCTQYSKKEGDNAKSL